MGISALQARILRASGCSHPRIAVDMEYALEGLARLADGRNDDGARGDERPDEADEDPEAPIVLVKHAGREHKTGQMTTIRMAKPQPHLLIHARALSRSSVV